MRPSIIRQAIVATGMLTAAAFAPTVCEYVAKDLSLSHARLAFGVTTCVPLTIAVIAVATVIRLTDDVTTSWRLMHPVIGTVLYLVFSVALFLVGNRTRSLYGFDPRYALFFVGLAMQVVAVALPALAIRGIAVTRNAARS